MNNDIYQVVLENESNKTLHHVAFFDCEWDARRCMDKLYANVVGKGICVKAFKNKLNSGAWDGSVDYNELLCKFD